MLVCVCVFSQTDFGNNVIRRIDLASQNVTLLAGQVGVYNNNAFDSVTTENTRFYQLGGVSFYNNTVPD
jgi:hypothetical protein